MADLRLLLILLLLPFQVSPSSFSSDLQTLQKDLNYTFKTLDLLRRAVTHPSYSLANYRSLSILGLSTIHSSVALDLLQTDPDADAKKLSRRIESFAGSAACAAAGARLGIERIVRVAAGTNMTAPAVVCGAFKGVLGAVAVDSGRVGAAGEVFWRWSGLGFGRRRLVVGLVVVLLCAGNGLLFSTVLLLLHFISSSIITGESLDVIV